MATITKIAGWALCAASVLLLISSGKLDLVVVLFPLSLLLGFVISARNRGEGHSAESRRKGVA